jgi:chromosome segregation ATPase
MKRFVLFLIAGGAIVPMLLMFVLPGCGTRLKVIEGGALERLDQMLGKMDVQRQEIDDGIKATKHAVEGIRTAKIKAQVKCEQIEDKAKPFEEKVAECDQSLARLRDLLKAGIPAEIAGKTYSVSDQKDMANRVIQARNDSQKQIDGFKAARENMKTVVASLGKQQQALETRLGRLQGQITTLNAEMTAAKAMKEASASMGDKNSTLAANLDGLEEKVATLSADVRAELRSETDRWSGTTEEKAVNDVDAFMRDSQKTPDTLAEIDRILGTPKK